MKNLIQILIILTLFSCKKETEIPKVQPGVRIEYYEQLIENFNNPPADYRTAPFWVWNNDVSKEDIDRTLTEYREKGFGGVFLHPRYGMITEYLSEEWFNLVEYALKKAEELDLNLWIYDENSFPSGFAGGHVPAQMPESNSEGVALQAHFVDKLIIPENLERVIHIFKKEKDSWIDITSDFEKEKGKTGEYCLLDLNDYESSKWFGGYSYIDLLKPGVTEKFIEITMPGYEKSIGHEFGKRVPGVFTDEPNTNTRRAGPIRYTPDLYEQFEKHWGYKLQPHIMSLIEETGDYKKIRHNFQSTILQLFIDRWAKPWYAYTEEKNLLWTGHYWEHGWPSPKEGPDNMAMYAWHQQPGIDMLFNAENERPDQFGNIRNVKELSSVANQFERHRTLSETYGAAGWELTFEDMKRLGDWEYVLGVNFMNQHLSYISLAGDRKHDFPQSFGTHSPYWGVFRYHTDYFARLSLALSSGFQRNKILVIEPTTTAWMYYNPVDRENPEMYKVKNQFEPFLVNLEKYQVEYDLGCENIIKNHGKIEGKKFIINKAAYDLVILPPGTENLDKTTYNLLNEFVSKGGKVLQINNEMQFVDGNKQSYDDLQKNNNWYILDLSSEKVFSELAKNKNIEFENPEHIKGNIFHHRREFENGQLLFLTNFDKNETSEFTVRLKGKSAINLDLFAGEAKLASFKNKGGMVELKVTLHPAGSQLFYISDDKGESKTEKTTKRESIKADVSKIKIPESNVLTLDYVELTMGKFRKEPMYYYSAANHIWQKHGYPDNPWVSSSQFKTELVDADNFGPGTGFKVVYPFYIDKEFQTDSIQMVVERAQLYTVKINGKIVNPHEWRRWLDPDFHVFEIGDYLQTGRNEVEINASPFSVFCELEPIYILGNFSLKSVEKGWKITKNNKLDFGPWKEQGMPFYGHTVSYSKDITVESESNYIIKLPDWKGTVAEVNIDGKHAGIIQTEPNEFTTFLTNGTHKIEVVVNGSNKNILGPHHNVSRRGIVTPWSFKFAPEVQPPGEEYDLLDYGLMTDFELFKPESMD